MTQGQYTTPQLTELNFKVEQLRSEIRSRHEFVSVLRRSLGRSISEGEFSDIIRRVGNHFEINDKAIAEHFKLDPTTVYRWKKGVSAPNEIVLLVVVKWLIERLSADAEQFADKLSGLSDDEISPGLESAFANTIIDSRITIIRNSWPLDQLGQFGTTRLTLRPLLISGAQEIARDTVRPTFQAFEWRAIGGGSITLTPSMVARELCVIPLSPGVLVQLAGGKRRAREVCGDRKLAATFFASSAEGADIPVLPSVQLELPQSDDGLPIARGLLIVSSEFGVPVTGDCDSTKFAAAKESVVDASSRKDVCHFVSTLDLQRQTSNESDDLREFTKESFGEYHHRRAVRFRNFTPWVVEDFETSRSKLPLSENRRLCLRILDLERFSFAPIDMSVHEGSEILTPMSGALQCHLATKEALIATKDAINRYTESQTHERSRILRSDLEEFDAIGSPEILRSKLDLNGDLRASFPDVLALDPSSVAHGFTAATKYARALSISVKEVDYSERWIAHSEPESEVQPRGEVIHFKRSSSQAQNEA